MKLRCKTSECEINRFKTTIYDENVILHTYNSNPFKGDTQNYTCKSYLEAFFLAHSNNPLKGEFQNCTCKSYLEALFLAHSNNPLKGDTQNCTCKSYLEALFLHTSLTLLKVTSKIVHVSPT